MIIGYLDLASAVGCRGLGFRAKRFDYATQDVHPTLTGLICAAGCVILAVGFQV